MTIFIFRAKNDLYSLIGYQNTNQNFVSTIEEMAVPNSMFINGIVINFQNVSGCQMTEGMMI